MVQGVWYRMFGFIRKYTRYTEAFCNGSTCAKLYQQKGGQLSEYLLDCCHEFLEKDVIIDV